MVTIIKKSFCLTVQVILYLLCKIFPVRSSIKQDYITRFVNGELSAGTYKADWNASNYSSGIYFYKLESDGFTDTKKMMIIK